MTQPYGQQPGQQPGQQGPGYPHTPAQGYPQGYPGTPPGGYPQAPGYGAMPSAPQEYSSGPIPRPGTATAAAVLAFVQAGITAIPGVLQLVAALGDTSGVDGSTVAESLAVAIIELVGCALLITGGVQLLGGKSRNLLIVGAVVELVLCAYYAIRVAAVDSQGIEAVDVGKGVLIGFAVFFAIMPVISLVMSLNATTTQFLQSRRGR